MLKTHKFLYGVHHRGGWRCFKVRASYLWHEGKDKADEEKKDKIDDDGSLEGPAFITMTSLLCIIDTFKMAHGDNISKKRRLVFYLHKTLCKEPHHFPHRLSSNIHVPHSVPHLKRAPVFEWFRVGCESKNGHTKPYVQKKGLDNVLKYRWPF